MSDSFCPALTKPPPYPPPTPTLVDPIILQFGKKRPGDRTPDNRPLFREKRLRLDSPLPDDPHALLQVIFSGERRFRPPTQRPPPPDPASLTYQWLMTAFWGQMLAQRGYVPPREEEPLDLTFKPAPKSVFSSIRHLAEPMEIRRCNSFPQTERPFGAEANPASPLGLLPSLEALANSAKLFSELKSNHPGFIKGGTNFNAGLPMMPILNR